MPAATESAFQAARANCDSIRDLPHHSAHARRSGRSACHARRGEGRGADPRRDHRGTRGERLRPLSSERLDRCVEHELTSRRAHPGTAVGERTGPSRERSPRSRPRLDRRNCRPCGSALPGSSAHNCNPPADGCVAAAAGPLGLPCQQDPLAAQDGDRRTGCRRFRGGLDRTPAQLNLLARRPTRSWRQ